MKIASPIKINQITNSQQIQIKSQDVIFQKGRRVKQNLAEVIHSLFFLDWHWNDDRIN